MVTIYKILVDIDTLLLSIDKRFPKETDENIIKLLTTEKSMLNTYRSMLLNNKVPNDSITLFSLLVKDIEEIINFKYLSPRKGNTAGC